MIETQQITKLIELERILNEYSGKRYHFEVDDDWLYSLVEILTWGKGKIIVEQLTLDQLLDFIKKNIRITIESPKDLITCYYCGEKFFSDTPKDVIELHQSKCPYATREANNEE